jgi:hypothetical protein
MSKTCIYYFSRGVIFEEAANDEQYEELRETMMRMKRSRMICLSTM